MTKKASVIIVDDEPLFLMGFASFLRELPIIKSIRICSGHRELIEECQHGNTDHIFININFNSYNAAAFCQEIKRIYPGVVLAEFAECYSEELVQKAKTFGADAFFNKNCDPEVILTYFTNWSMDSIHGFYVPLILPPN